MKKFRKVVVYPKAGQTNISFCREKTGVYLIFRNGLLRYVGMSGSDLYKTITRHFQDWRDNSQVRTTYPQTTSYTVSVVFCTKAQALRLERALILKLKPVDNPDKLKNYQLTIEDNKTAKEFAGIEYENPPF